MSDNACTILGLSAGRPVRWPVWAGEPRAGRPRRLPRNAHPSVSNALRYETNRRGESPHSVSVTTSDCGRLHETPKPRPSRTPSPPKRLKCAVSWHIQLKIETEDNLKVTKTNESTIDVLQGYFRHSSSDMSFLLQNEISLYYRIHLNLGVNSFSIWLRLLVQNSIYKEETPIQNMPSYEESAGQ